MLPDAHARDDALAGKADESLFVDQKQLCCRGGLQQWLKFELRMRPDHEGKYPSAFPFPEYSSRGWFEKQNLTPFWSRIAVCAILKASTCICVPLVRVRLKQ